MAMPGRGFSAGTQYRYGFNGQEKSTEIGEGLTTAEFWEYDSRIGRRWNLDPLRAKYPFQSPYVTFNNNPIHFDDPTGLEGDSTTGHPCGTCGRQETGVQKTARIAIVNLARVYNAKYLFKLNRKEEDGDVNAPQLFYQWVMGTGKGERNFDENSRMGKQMLEAEEVKGGIDDAIKKFKPYGGREQVDFARSLSDENPLLYVKSFMDDLDDNPARAFHGSYRGKAIVTKAEETALGVNYQINIKIWDNMTATSGFRLPPFLGGYEKNASIFSGPNPYGPNGNFRTIKIEYDMNIKVFRYNSAAKDALNLIRYLMF